MPVAKIGLFGRRVEMKQRFSAAAIIPRDSIAESEVWVIEFELAR